jgi:hypothetical protein
VIAQALQALLALSPAEAAEPCTAGFGGLRDLFALAEAGELAAWDSDCDGVLDAEDEHFDGPVSVEIEQPWTDGVHRWTAAFTLTSVAEGEHLATLRVHLDGPRDAAREQGWETVVEQTWSRDGLALDLVFVDHATNAHSTVEVRHGEGWANAGTWFTADSGLVVAHEVGHQLGLMDEYPDPLVPHRPLGPTDSIMRSARAADRPRSHPWHQRAIQALFRCP